MNIDRGSYWPLQIVRQISGTRAECMQVDTCGSPDQCIINKAEGICPQAGRRRGSIYSPFDACIFR